MQSLYISSALSQCPEGGPEAVQERHHEGSRDGYSAARRWYTLSDHQKQTI